MAATPLLSATRLAAAVRPPYRPEPGRGRGRPVVAADEDVVAGPAAPLPPLAPVERRAFDYSDLERGMAQDRPRQWVTAPAPMPRRSLL
jgi:hypothetical protein